MKSVGLAIVLQFYRLRKAVALDEVALHEADATPDADADADVPAGAGSAADSGEDAR